MTLRRSGEAPFHIYEFDDVVILTFLVDIVDGDRCIINLIRWKILHGVSTFYILLHAKHVWCDTTSIAFRISDQEDNKSAHPDTSSVLAIDDIWAQLTNAVGGIIIFLDDVSCSDNALRWLKSQGSTEIKLPNKPITSRLRKIFDVLQLTESDEEDLASLPPKSTIETMSTSDTKSWPEMDDTFDQPDFDFQSTSIPWLDLGPDRDEGSMSPPNSSSAEQSQLLPYDFEEPLLPYSTSSSSDSLYLSLYDEPRRIDPLDCFEWRARGLVEELKSLLHGQDHTEVCALLRDHMKSLKIDKPPLRQSKSSKTAWAGGGVTTRMQKLASKVGRKIRRVVDG